MATPIMHYPTSEIINDVEKHEHYEKKSKKKNLKGKFFIVFLVIVILGLAGGVTYLYMQYKDSQDELKKLKDPTNYAEVQNSLADATLAKLRKLIVVPTSEKPTMYTVINANELKKTNQEFYGDVQNGDQIIIYSNKLIIYREKDNLIVNASYFPANSLQEAASGQQKTDITSK